MTQGAPHEEPRREGFRHPDSDHRAGISSRLVPVKLDGRGGPLRRQRRVTRRVVVRIVFATVGLGVFLFGRIGAATGTALPLMRYHVLAQVVGLVIAASALLVGLQHKR